MSYRQEIQSGFSAGVKKGWDGFTWILKILVPVSFATLIIEYSGVLGHLDFLFAPLMGFLYLPAMAAFPLVIGLTTGIYAAIAAMSVLPLTTEQMTVLAVFLLISHFYVQEGIIQGKSGIHPAKAILARLAASIAAAAIVARLIGCEPTATGSTAAMASGGLPFIVVLKAWCFATLSLAVKILVILMVLMVLLEIMKQLNLIRYLVKPLSPVLRLMGLNHRLGMLWLTAVVFGLAYGAAIIVEETKEGDFTADELTRLHLSIGINHSMIEDPLLFLALGLNPLWLWVPRLLAAIAAVHIYRLISALWKRVPVLHPKNRPPVR